MPKKVRALLALLLGAVLVLTACGGGGGSSSSAGDASSAAGSASSADGSSSEQEPEKSEEPDKEPEPELNYVNPLTGEACAEDIAEKRPIAIMLNNLKGKALPQLGVSQADIIYEMVAEGGITRMMAVFQDTKDVGLIGTVRSARDYYVSLAYGHDAIFLHAGGSPQAYTVIQKWGVTNMDCVNGPYEGSLFWRDQERKTQRGLEHSVLTSGEKIQELFPTYTNIRQTHKEDFKEPFTFMAEGEKAKGESGSELTVKFSNVKTGVFTYDESTGLYKIEEYGEPYVDGNNNEQVSVKNVLVLYTSISNVAGDDKGRMSIKTTGSGSGLFLCDGTSQEITWSKAKDSAPMTYEDADGNPLKMGVGPTYINIVRKTDSVEVS